MLKRIIMVAVLVTGWATPALARDALEPCPTEDSDDCYWDAPMTGSGRGKSFIALPGGRILNAGSFDYAQRMADACETDTAWAEQVAPGVWAAVCGDADGNGPVNSCAQKAELDWALATLAGEDGDAAYEDAYAACTEGR